MERLTVSDIAGFCGAKVPAGCEGLAVSDVSTDSRSVSPGSLFVPLVGEHFDGHDFLDAASRGGAAAALCARDVPEPPLPLLSVADTRVALGDIAEGYKRRFPVKTVGVTGSVGKTTTKEIISSVLSQRYHTLKNEGNLNNDIGVPVSILKLDRSHEAAVFEMGMNHFGEIAKLTRLVRPNVAVITCIGVSHIEYLGSREGILKAKLEILGGLSPGGIAVFNGDEPLLWNLKGKLGCDIVYYGIENPLCDIRAGGIVTVGDGMTFTVSAPGNRFEAGIRMAGRHNVYNALAAAAAGLYFGLSPEEVAAGLTGARNTGMRQRIFAAGRYTIVDDCYNANPDSMAAALSVLAELPAQGRKLAALGGMLELGDVSERAHARVGKLAASCADALFLYGKGAEWYREGALEAGISPENARLFGTHEELSRALRAFSRPGDAILFKGSRGMRMEAALKLFLEEVK